MIWRVLSDFGAGYEFVFKEVLTTCFGVTFFCLSRIYQVHMASIFGETVKLRSFWKALVSGIIYLYIRVVYIYILEVLEVYRHPPKRKRLFIKFRSNKNREPNERSRCYHSLSHEVISSYPGGEGSRVPQKAMGKNSHQFFEMHTRMSTEVIVTIVSKSVYFTYLGDLQPTYIGVK